MPFTSTGFSRESYQWQFIFERKQKYAWDIPYTPGGGGAPSYKPYRYLPPQQVGFWGLFGLKTGIHLLGYTLCLFWSGIGYGLRGNYGSV